MTKAYDVVVLGAGPGGYVAAIRAAQLGLKVAIIEKKWWGGVCLNVGCIPSKALLRNAELAHIVTHRAKEFGFSFGSVGLDYSAAFRRSRDVSDKMTRGVKFLMRKNKIDSYEGWGTFTDAKTIQVNLNGGGTETLTATNVILGVGASTRLLPNTTVSERVRTYLEVIMADTLPKSIIIVGGGAIGMEFGYVMRSYGVEVTIVEFLPALLPNEDEDISREIEKQYIKLGVKVHTGTRVDKIEDTGSGVRVTVTKGDQVQTLEADQVMQSIGWQANTQGFGLENTGVQLDKRGFIAINEKMQTNVPGVYAIGDCAGQVMLAHVATAMGIIAAENIAGAKTITLEYKMMPRCTYCQPQVASFGYTEKEAREKGYKVKVAKFPWQANGKANGLGDSVGFVKLISDARYGELLGAHLIGPEVTELLPELTLARMWELTPEEIARNVHAHPTLSEALMDAAEGLEGEMINL